MSNLVGSSKIVIAGGSGFLGLSLAKYLTDRGARVVILSRAAPVISGAWEHVVWDGRSLGAWKDSLRGVSGLVNLAGRSVDCVKTPDHQDEILRSRVESTRVLGAALRTLSDPPPVWVQMSTAHIYGDPPTAVCDEDSEFGYGLAPTVGRAWEGAFRESVLPSQRQVILRTSFVLGHGLGAGMGALSKLVPLVRLGLGGRIGSGRQGMSWIHERDMNRLFERGLTDGAMNGVYVASAPNPVPQAELMRELRRAIGVPIGLPAFEWMVRIGAPLLLRTDPELALYGRYVVSRRLKEDGFEFSFPTIREAMQELFARKRQGS
jgi:hypothetical protein